MSILDDMLAQSREEYARRGYDQDKKVEVYIKDVSLDNCEELRSVFEFLEQCGFSSSLLEENMEHLSIQIDGYQASKGYSTQGKITINNRNNKDTILHEMFHQASSNFEFGDSGVKTINEDNSLNGVALNEGITEYLTKMLNPDYKVDYEAEYLVAKRLLESYGLENTLPGYFEADRMLFEDAFGEENYENITYIFKLLDRYEVVMSQPQNMNTTMEVIKIFDAINVFLEKMNIETIDFSNASELINGSQSRK